MSSYLDRRRDVSGLVVTVAVHAGLAAALLLLVDQVVRPAPPPPPIIAHPIADPPRPVVLPDPQPHLLPVPTPVPQPVWQTDDPPPVDPILDKGFTTSLPGASTDPIGGPPVIPTIADPPAEPSRAPRFVAGGASQPPYPTASRRLGEEGAVVVAVSIDANGAITDVRLVTSSGFARLDQAALDHARRRWRFEPALQDGQPVAATRTITVSFRLANG